MAITAPPADSSLSNTPPRWESRKTFPKIGKASHEVAASRRTYLTENFCLYGRALRVPTRCTACCNVCFAVDDNADDTIRTETLLTVNSASRYCGPTRQSMTDCRCLRRPGWWQGLRNRKTSKRETKNCSVQPRQRAHLCFQQCSCSSLSA